MVKRHTIQWSKEKNKRQTMICKTLHRKVKSEQHEPLGEKNGVELMCSGRVELRCSGRVAKATME
jgi:hypothetical protein